jgi:glycolate oxidase FAD binding subunit
MMSVTRLAPQNAEEVAAAVASSTCALVPRGGGTKPALSDAPDDAVALELGGLRGVVEYEPAEYTVTVLAGTPVAEVDAMLREHGQYLPFDPLFAAAGATVGGSVAAGTNGPGRLRYGGVRDFVLGVRFVDGRGRLARGGGKVVKNAAGFDLPKLMVGSLGRLGVLVELTFKVFPAPEATASLRAGLPSLEAAVDVIRRLAGRPFDLDAVELVPPGELWVRIAGSETALPGRLDRLAGVLRESGASAVDVVGQRKAEAQWSAARELTWVPVEHGLMKVPLVLGRIPSLERRLAPASPRRYGAAGQQLLLSWSGGEGKTGVGVVDALRELGLRGLVLRRGSGEGGSVVVGAMAKAGAFAVRVKAAMDPLGRFLAV